MPMQVRGTATPNSPPTGLVERQLSVEMGSSPPILWCGVPASIDPVNGRVQISPPVDYVSTSALATALSTFQQSVTQVTPTAGQVMFVQNDNVLRANPQLQLYDGGQAGMVMQTANNVATSGDYITLLRSRNTLASPTAVASGDQLGSVNFGGFPHVAGQVAGITVWTTQPWTTANKGCWMDLAVIANNTNTQASTLQLGQSGAISMPRVTPTRITDGAANAGWADLLVMGADGVVRRNAQIGVGDWATTMPGGGECGLVLTSYMGNQANMAGYIALQNSRGTQATPTATQNGDYLGYLHFQGFPIGVTGAAGGAMFNCVATENHTATAKGGELIAACARNGGTLHYHTWRSRAIANGSELHLCQANGFYNTPPAVTAAQIWWNLQVTGASDASNTNLYIGHSADPNNNGLWFTKLAGVQTPNQYSWWMGGSISTTGTITPGCDERDKENIEDQSAGLDEVLRLRSRRWRRAGVRQSGLVAQEVEGVIPDAVVTRRHPRLEADPEARIERADYKFLDPMAIIAALVNSVKSLSDRVAALEVAHG